MPSENFEGWLDELLFKACLVPVQGHAGALDLPKG